MKNVKTSGNTTNLKTHNVLYYKSILQKYINTRG